MAEKKRQAEVPTNKNKGSICKVPVTPDPPVKAAAIILYGARLSAGRNKTTGEVEVTKLEDDPQFSPAADVLECQLKFVVEEVVKLRMDKIVDPNGVYMRRPATNLPLAALLIVTHGNDNAQVIPYTQLVFKQEPQKDEKGKIVSYRNRWRDVESGAVAVFEEFLEGAGKPKSQGIVVHFGCEAGSQIDSIADLNVAAWDVRLDWEMPGFGSEVWVTEKSKISAEDLAKWKNKKAGMKGTGLVKLHNEPREAPCREPGSLHPQTVKGPLAGTLQRDDTVVTLVRKAALKVVKGQ